MNHLEFIQEFNHKKLTSKPLTEESLIKTFKNVDNSLLPFLDICDKNSLQILPIISGLYECGKLNKLNKISSNILLTHLKFNKDNYPIEDKDIYNLLILSSMNKDNNFQNYIHFGKFIQNETMKNTCIQNICYNTLSLDNSFEYQIKVFHALNKLGDIPEKIKTMIPKAYESSFKQETITLEEVSFNPYKISVEYKIKPVHIHNLMSQFLKKYSEVYPEHIFLMKEDRSNWNIKYYVNNKEHSQQIIQGFEQFLIVLDYNKNLNKTDKMQNFINTHFESLFIKTTLEHSLSENETKKSSKMKI